MKFFSGGRALVSKNGSLWRSAFRNLVTPLRHDEAARDQGYFLLKGLRKVRGEFSLTALAYNLKRVLNIVGVPQLLAVHA